jgi:prepilin-type N-terminal cleavage/methylation domain-containing protein
MSFSKNFQKGFTFVELTVVLTILLVLITLVTVFINPLDQIKKSRDEKRLADMTTLERAINEFSLDNKRYPDFEDTLRVSTSLPSGSLNLSNANLGWLYDDLSGYLDKQPIDPLNNSEFFYSYMHTSTGYELNARLEYFTDEMINDGGDRDDLYETGNNLNLIPY